MPNTPFLGPAYQSRSKTLADQRLINLYLETVESKTGATPAAFYGAPGLDFLCSCGSGPVRGFSRLGQTLYVVSGQGVYAVSTNFTVTVIGTILSGSGEVSMINNGPPGGNQIAIFDNVNGYTVIGGAVATITPPVAAWNPGTGVFQDGFGLVNQLGSQNIWQSNLNDLSTWQPLNYGVESGLNTNIIALQDIHRQVYVFKENSVFPWVNAGLSGFAFQRLDGVSMESGCIAPSSVCKSGERLLWLGANDEGQGVVYMAQGYSPERVSTHAIEYQISTYPTITDAVCYTYQQEGHEFYVMNFPSGNTTWCLDLTTTRHIGTPCWHQRAAFSNGQFLRHQINNAVAFAGRVVVGDYESGNLYAYNLNTYTDNGAPRKWLRSWRANQKTTSQSVRVNSLELHLEAGGVTPLANPKIALRQSFDGFDWSSEYYATASMVGQTAARCQWKRLGTERRGLGTDRIFEISSTDAFKVALLEAEIK
jgi:hypothetical protein